MNVDRYLATHYPIFHRTSVTKGKLLALFTVLVLIELTSAAMSINDLVISFQVHLLIFFHHLIFLFLYYIFISPMLFINYKLFTVARKSRRNNEISPEMKKSFSLKKISNCLLVVACLSVLSIPTFVYTGLTLTSIDTEYILNNVEFVGLWAKTIASMNSTFNCLIFYWKNKTLRAEGMEVIKSIKIC